MRRTLSVASVVCFLFVFAGLALAEAAAAPEAPAGPLASCVASAGQVDQPAALPLLLPEPSNLCVQCTVEQERRCAGSCIADGHLGGACGFCTLECFCFGEAGGGQTS